jgi:hypothetical protein
MPWATLEANRMAEEAEGGRQGGREQWFSKDREVMEDN